MDSLAEPPMDAELVESEGGGEGTLRARYKDLEVELDGDSALSFFTGVAVGAMGLAYLLMRR